MSAPQTIVIHQTVLHSWACDLGSMATLLGGTFINFRFCGGSAWINAAIAIVWILWLLGRSVRMARNGVKTPAEARAWLDKEFPVEAGEAA